MIGSSLAGWTALHIYTGLSSGEGVILALRATRDGDPARDNEPLLTDKRLLVVQSECSSVLALSRRLEDQAQRHAQATVSKAS